MRIRVIDNILYIGMKILKHFDKRPLDLKYFDPDKVKNILVVSSTAIGDTLLSTPAIRAVRERYPNAKIIAHFNVKNMELFENNPHIDGIIPYYGGYKKFFKTIKEFRKHKFDLVLIFHGNEPQATPMAYLSGAKFIIKVPIPKKYNFLLSNKTNGFENPWNHHAIDVRLKTASFAGCNSTSKKMEFVVDEKTKKEVKKFLERLNISERSILVGFVPGAASKFKIWPKENFIELGKRLISYKSTLKIILIGSKKEKKLIYEIEKGIGDNVIKIAGDLSLKQVAALIQKLNFLVTNDTGLMHIAIALKVRTISLFCPSNWWGVGPIQDLHLHKIIAKEKPCNPCITKKCKDNFCMKQIQVEEVFEAAKEML